MCDDGNACTETDTCQAGTCTGSNPVVCTSLDQCHDPGTCDASTGVCSDPAKPEDTTCDDNDACTQTDTCQAGECTGSNPVECTALDQCHDPGTCDPSTGVCSDPAKPDDTACDDDDACTQTDTCQAGECTGSNPVECTALDQCHDPGTCDPSTGVCSDPAKPDDTACDDDDACTQTDTCQAGECTGSNPVECTALDQCHDPGTCDPSTGVCSDPVKPDDTVCDDGNACTQIDRCAGGICVGGPALVCNNGLFCDGDEPCDVVLGCQPGAYPCTDPFLPQCDEKNDACVVCLILGDATGNTVVDLEDFGVFPTCMTSPVGPINPAVFAAPCGCFDMDIDGDVDLRDFRSFQLAFDGAE